MNGFCLSYHVSVEKNDYELVPALETTIRNFFQIAKIKPFTKPRFERGKHVRLSAAGREVRLEYMHLWLGTVKSVTPGFVIVAWPNGHVWKEPEEFVTELL